MLKLRPEELARSRGNEALALIEGEAMSGLRRVGECRISRQRSILATRCPICSLQQHRRSWLRRR